MKKILTLIFTVISLTMFSQSVNRPALDWGVTVADISVSDSIKANTGTFLGALRAAGATFFDLPDDATVDSLVTAEDGILKRTTINVIYDSIPLMRNTDHIVLRNAGDAFILTGTYDAGWTEPDLGAGARLVWHPKKAAFRAGYVALTQWNEASIGGFSFAGGYGTTASGDGSTALCYNTTASGAYSFACGVSTTASGIGSTSTGSSTTASGSATFSGGFNTKAEAMYSVAFGRYNVGGGAVTWVETDPLFQLGNGTADESRANAFEVLKNGQTKASLIVIAPVIAITSTDTASLSGTYTYPVGSMFTRITASDTSLWLKIKLTGPIAARWKKVTLTP
jgi:hypothetical protein